MAGQEDSLPRADAHLCWAAGARLFVLRMKAAGKRQKGKALIGTKGIAEGKKKSDSLLNYFRIPKLLNSLILLSAAGMSLEV